MGNSINPALAEPIRVVVTFKKRERKKKLSMACHFGYGLSLWLYYLLFLPLRTKHLTPAETGLKMVVELTGLKERCDGLRKCAFVCNSFSPLLGTYPEFALVVFSKDSRY